MMMSVSSGLLIGREIDKIIDTTITFRSYELG